MANNEDKKDDINANDEGDDTQIEGAAAQDDDEGAEDLSGDEDDDDSEEGDGEGDGDQDDDDGNGDDDTFSVTIGDDDDEDADEKAPKWVKELRKKNREQAKRIKELESKGQGTETKLPALGKKPKLEDFDWDDEKYEAALDKWKDDKRKHDDAAKVIEEKNQASQKAWDDQVAAHEQKQKDLNAPDLEEVKEIYQGALSQVQQGIIVSGAKNSALLLYAIGKHPEKAAELAKITDPVKFAFTVAKMEDKLKVKGKQAPKPESKVKGSAQKGATGGDKKLEALRAEAEKTGDMSKVMAYKTQMKRAAAKS